MMIRVICLILMLAPLTVFIASTHSTLLHELKHAKEFSSLKISCYIVLFRTMEEEKSGLYEENWKHCVSVQIKKFNTTVYFPNVFCKNFRLTGFFNTCFRKQEYVPLNMVKKIALAPVKTKETVIFPLIAAALCIAALLYSAFICSLPVMVLFSELLLYLVVLTLFNLSHFLLGKPNSKTKNDGYYFENPSEWYEK